MTDRRRAVLGLGANLGEPRDTLRAALRDLTARPGIQVVGVSGLWRTAPVGGPDQPDFLNAVVVVDTTLTAEQLLATAHDLESAAGRVRDVRWGPRTLDVDIVDVAGEVLDDPLLTVPHPRAHQRAFVLAPWAQLDPNWPLRPAGLDSAPVARWLIEVGGQEIELVDDGQWWS